MLLPEWPAVYKVMRCLVVSRSTMTSCRNLFQYLQAPFLMEHLERELLVHAPSDTLLLDVLSTLPFAPQFSSIGLAAYGIDKDKADFLQQCAEKRVLPHRREKLTFQNRSFYICEQKPVFADPETARLHVTGGMPYHVDVNIPRREDYAGFASWLGMLDRAYVPTGFNMTLSYQDGYDCLAYDRLSGPGWSPVMSLRLGGDLPSAQKQELRDWFCNLGTKHSASVVQPVFRLC